MNINKAREYIINRLASELQPPYMYHNVEHTMDVVSAVIRLAALEEISESDTSMIYTAALFHDSGMLETYIDHEEASVRLIRKVLPEFEFSSDQIEQIGKMIMATKLPQFAETQFEKILCDADLDYLGRDDFFMIGLRLQYEWNMLDYRKTTLREWYKLQIDFLTSHHYFTNAAIDLRESKKNDNLFQIREICGLHPGKSH